VQVVCGGGGAWLVVAGLLVGGAVAELDSVSGAELCGGVETGVDTVTGVVTGVVCTVGAVGAATG